MKYLSAIFDMDGLLLDSERVAMECFLQACRQCGFEASPDVYMQTIGVNVQQSNEILSAGYGADFPCAEVRKIWAHSYREKVLQGDISLKPGVHSLLDSLQAADISMAVATSTVKALAELKLEKAGLLHYFKTVTGGDQVEQSKPFPDIYLLAAASVNTPAQACLAFEDSNAGVKAAVSAQMKVFQVPDLIEPTAEVLALGHKVIRSLQDFSLAELENHLLEEKQ